MIEPLFTHRIKKVGDVKNLIILLEVEVGNQIISLKVLIKTRVYIDEVVMII